MSAKNQGTRSELIHCPNCGEDYASTYRRCPFCDGKPPKEAPADDYEPEEGYEEEYYEEEDKGGKRLVTNTRGGGYGGRPGVGKIIAYVVALIAVLALIIFLIFKLGPLVGKLSQNKPAPTPAVTASAPPSQAPASQAPTAAPATATAAPASQAPATQPPTAAPAVALKLNRDDFTLNNVWPYFTVEASGGSGKITWTIDDESVATVNANGRVDAVGSGWTTLTAKDEAGHTATCIVRVSGDFLSNSSSAGPAPSQTPASQAPETQAPSDGGDDAPAAAKPRLSTEDFTLSETYGYTAKLRVIDGEAESWSSANEAIATVDENGLVTGHKSGDTTITCTLADGTKLESIVRVH